MSVSIERCQLVAIASTVHVGSLEIEAHLRTSLKKKPIIGFFNKIEEKLWKKIAQEHPCKDFTGEKESKTRANILKRICTVLKSKFFKNICMRALAVFR